jgi:two-component system CheB/CheR fusion protein
MVTAELRNSLAALRNAARVLSILGHRDSRLTWLGGVLDRQVNRLTQVADELRDTDDVPAVLPADSGDGERPAEVGSDALCPAIAPRRVLVVDDNVDAAESLAVILSLAGHVVHTVYDGPTSLAAAHWFRPDVVFLDLGLPGLDGWEVARRLRRSEGFQRNQLIAITGFDREELRERSEAAGIGIHLVKPVDPAELERLLAKVPARKQE